MGQTVAVDRHEVEALPWHRFAQRTDILYRIVWKDPWGESYAGVLQLEPGAEIDRHRHRSGAHHVWVATGTCVVDGRNLAEGSYAFVSPGEMHGVEAGPEGCTLFYLFLQPDVSREA